MEKIRVLNLNPFNRYQGLQSSDWFHFTDASHRADRHELKETDGR